MRRQALRRLILAVGWKFFISILDFGSSTPSLDCSSTCTNTSSNPTLGVSLLARKVSQGAAVVNDAKRERTSRPWSATPNYCKFEQRKSAGSFAVHLRDIAIGMISGRNEFFDSVHDSVLQYAPRGTLIVAPGKCGCSFRWGLKLLKETHPDAKWYYIGDEDAFINLENLLALVSSYDSSQPIVISCVGPNVISEHCGVSPPGLTNAFFGGTGQILSAALVHSVEYSKRLNFTCGDVIVENTADLENTCSLAQSWDDRFHHVSLGPVAPVDVFDYRIMFPSARTVYVQNPISDVVVVHHLEPHEIAALAHVNHKFVIQSDPAWQELSPLKMQKLKLPSECPNPEKDNGWAKRPPVL